MTESDTSLENKVTQLVISGRVQGVNYRRWLQQTALSLKVSGWCRNAKDGSVVAEVFANAEQLSELVDKCYGGPEHSRVTLVQAIAVKDAVKTTQGFEIRQ